MIDSRSSALILIDYQEAFCSPSGSMSRQGREISTCVAAAANANLLAAAARRAGVLVIWTRYRLRPDYRDGGWFTGELRPNISRSGSLRSDAKDSEIWSGMDVGSEDVVLDKPRMSCFYASPLEATLRGMDITTLFIAGVTTSMCVESTVRDASQRDYRVHVIKDACGDWAQERHQPSLEAMAFGFAYMKTTTEFIDELRESPEQELHRPNEG